MLVIKRPVLNIVKDDDNKNMLFHCHQLIGDSLVFADVERPITITGQCKITGASDDKPAGWTLGFIQLQWVETNWAYYQGEKNTGGSCLVRRDRPPARSVQGCRDTLRQGAILFDNDPGRDRAVAGSGPLPLTLRATLSDPPNDFWPLTRRNALKGTTNFLREAQLEFHFCTILALMDPDPRRQARALLDLENAFQYLKHVFWNVHWQAKFMPTNFADVAARWTITPSGGALGNTVNVSRVFDGGPTDARFKGIGAAFLATNCLKAEQDAHKSPNVTESAIWQ
jgi:hypothetical protein